MEHARGSSSGYGGGRYDRGGGGGRGGGGFDRDGGGRYGRQRYDSNLKACLHCTHDMGPMGINPLRLHLHYNWIEPNLIQSRSISIHFVRWF